MRTNLRANAVFERRHNLAARGVVFRVGGEDDRHVELQPNGVAFNLYVAFLHDVEQRDLNLAGEVRNFINGEDAAICAGQQSIVHGQFGAKLLSGARSLNGVYVADEVGYGYVWGSKLFDVAVFRSHPRDGGILTLLRENILAVARQRRVGIVAQLGSGNVGNLGIEQSRQRTQNAALGLSTQT